MATQIVDQAWRDLPDGQRVLLQNICADRRHLVDRPLGDAVEDLLASAGNAEASQRARRDLHSALGAWIPELGLVVIDAGHPALRGVDQQTYEAVIARVAWHEWGHALSIVRSTPDDVLAGPRLLELAPEGIVQNIRNAGYGRRDYVHELVANLYALLMSRRRLGQHGQPPWLADDLYTLMKRVAGWNQ